MIQLILEPINVWFEMNYPRENYTVYKETFEKQNI